MSIYSRLTLGFLLIFILLLSAGAIIWWRSQLSNQYISNIVNTHTVKTALAVSMYKAANDSVFTLQQMAALNNLEARRQIYDEFQLLNQSFQQDYQKFLQLPLSDKEKDSLERISTFSTHRAQLLASLADVLLATAQTTDVNRQIRELIPAQEAVRDSLEYLAQLQRQATQTAELEAHQTYQTTVMIIGILGLFICLTGGITAYSSLRYVRTTEQRLQQMQKAAETAQRAKSDFLANMSHELRTPLNALIGMSHLLSESELNTEQQELVDTMRSSSDEFLRLVNDMLDFAKIESGQFKLEEREFNIRHILQEVVDKIAIKSAAKQLELTMAIDERIPQRFLGDANRLANILNHLLLNAVKFTDAGEINITVTNRALPDNPTQPHRTELYFIVRDTGIGIPIERMDTLFQSFTQADTSMTRRYGGAGLGLTISRHLCQVMGGTLWAESEVGKGSTFHFTVVMPFVPQIILSTTMAKNQARDEIEKNPLRILLAEDNITNQRVATLILKRLGYEPDIVNNGIEAIAAIEQQVYDIVLMDIQMPQMDGIQATQRIHERWSESQRPYIIAMTAHALRGDREKCLAAGMNDYVSKPVRPNDLEKAINRWEQYAEQQRQGMQWEQVRKV